MLVIVALQQECNYLIHKVRSKEPVVEIVQLSASNNIFDCSGSPWTEHITRRRWSHLRNLLTTLYFIYSNNC